MKNKKILVAIIAIILVFLITFIIAFTINKKGKEKVAPISKDTETVKELVLEDSQKPYISITPQFDGRRLDIKITNIPASVIEIEYDLIYTAQDGNLEIEKGVGGTAKIDSSVFERELLLGTESCTNGCKYKYDENIVGGILILNFLTKDNQSAYFEAPFVFVNSADIKANGGLSLKEEGFSIKASVTSKNEYFILIKNYQPLYSVFSSASGVGTVSSITPDNITKEDMTTLAGDYIIK